MDQIARFKYQGALSDYFRPGAPIDSLALFSGRTEQVNAVFSAIFQPGQHVIMFGERGVGKTSLAKTLSELLGKAGITPLSSGTINCDGTDDFSALWHKVFRELQIVVRLQKPGFAPGQDSETISFDGFLPEKVTPDDVRVAVSRSLGAMTDSKRMIVVLDEVDRIRKKNVTTLLADTIKNLSDHLVPVTIILVGVADAVDQLISEHGSVERSLIQVPVPRMSAVELEEVISKGLTKAGMEISAVSKNKIVQLSQGLPHFTHLLTLESALHAIDRDSTKVDMEDVIAATGSAVSKSHSLLSSYIKATNSPQKNTLYSDVLLACALATKDELGWFTASSVAAPLSELMEKDYSIPYYSRHLNEFCEDKRGKILQKSGTVRQYRYRFLNPLIQPFVVVHAISKGKAIDTIATI